MTFKRLKAQLFKKSFLTFQLSKAQKSFQYLNYDLEIFENFYFDFSILKSSIFISIIEY